MSHGRRIARLKLIPPSPDTAEKYLRIWPKRQLFFEPGSFPLLTASALFGIDQPLQLEIGCGSGEFLCSLAGQFSDKYFIGVEVSRRAVYAAVEKAKKALLDNILFIYTDFKLTYPLLRPNSIKAVYLHFPDPNYPTKYHKRRIFDPEFLDYIHPVLTSDGFIDVVTDQQPFFLHMLGVAESDDRFRLADIQHPVIDLQVKSRFQRAWERAERQVFRFELRKKAVLPEAQGF